MMPTKPFAALAGLSVSLLAPVTGAMAAESSGIQLPAITVISNGVEQLKATGGSVVSQEDIEKIQPKNPAELFRREATVTVSGGPTVAQRIHVNGLEQSYLAVTVDGARQPGTMWHHAGSSLIDPAFLKRVEVEAGAAAADSGFASAAGALRYQTVNAYDLLSDGKSVGARIRAGWGSNGQGFSGNVAGYAAANGFDVLGIVNRNRGTDYKDGAGRRVRGTKNDLVSGLGKIGFEHDGNRIEASAERNRDSSNRLVRMNMQIATDNLPFTLVRDTVTLKYSRTEPRGLWDPEVVVYYNAMDFDRPHQTPTSIVGDFQARAVSIGGKVQNRFDLGAGNIVTGVDLMRNTLDLTRYGNRTTIPARDIEEENNQIGAFAQARFDFANGIDLSAGARIDGHSYKAMDGVKNSDAGVSLNATLAYEVVEGVQVYGAASRTWLGYQQGQIGLLHARDYLTASTYKPATAVNFKAGINVSQGSWTAGFGVFDTRVSDLTRLEYIRPTLGYRNNELADIRSRGFIANAAYSWGSGNIGLNASKALVTKGGSTVLPEGGEAMPVGTSVRIFADQTVESINSRFGFDVTYEGGFGEARLRQLGFRDQPAYALANIFAEWSPPQVKDLTVRLAADNLFDANYYPRSTYPYTARVTPLFGPGRVVSLTSTIKF